MSLRNKPRDAAVFGVDKRAFHEDLAVADMSGWEDLLTTISSICPADTPKG